MNNVIIATALNRHVRIYLFNSKEMVQKAKDIHDLIINIVWDAKIRNFFLFVKFQKKIVYLYLGKCIALSYKVVL